MSKSFIGIDSHKIRLLAASSLFSELSDEEFSALDSLSHTQIVPPKKTVFFKGDAGNSMYAVIEGRLKVHNVSSDGREIILGFLEAGSIFGEIALMDGKPRTATVVTVETCKLLVIDRPSFLRFLESQPKVALKLMIAMCDRLRATDELLENIVFMNLPSRLIRILKILSEKYGKPVSNGVKLGIKLSQQELASLIGASRESVNKQLRAWEDEGLLMMLEGQMILDQKLFCSA